MSEQCREPVEVGEHTWYCTRDADHDGPHSLHLTWETGEYPPNWIAPGSVVVRCAARRHATEQERDDE